MKKRDWLIKIRKEKNKSPIEIANDVGITYQFYWFIEQGRRRPSPELAKKIADILNFSWTRFYE